MTPPRIETLTEKKLVGMHLKMSYANNRTFELWSIFMPRHREIVNAVGAYRLSMQVFDPPFDQLTFTPATVFEKWAVMEVTDYDQVPEGMDTFTLPGGLYAVFIHRGSPSRFHETFHYIFKTWLPVSGYEVDERPQFELLGEKYKNNSEDSEEEVWIPVKVSLS